jgi:hypothetical protein
VVGFESMWVEVIYRVEVIDREEAGNYNELDK